MAQYSILSKYWREVLSWSVIELNFFYKMGRALFLVIWFVGLDSLKKLIFFFLLIKIMAKILSSFHKGIMSVNTLV
jgi:hypothetical protein